MKKYLFLIVFLVLVSSALAQPNIKWMYEDKNKEQYMFQMQEILSRYNPQVSIITIHKNIIGRNICGYGFASGKISITTQPVCDFGNVFEHEVKHIVFFQMKYREQKNYCMQHGYIGVIRACWEEYADEF